jgi:hypothetical protein|tara:strand:- start:57 stop:281 length:225 start_codon:yes stop_codon:yes gene_type:complete
MIKVWLLLLLMSQPGMPSVKHNAFLYSNEEECMEALASYLNIYESKPLEYKQKLVTTGYCLPFDAFPIQGLNTL